MADDTFREHLERQIFGAFGFTSIEDVDDAFDPDGSYRAARAEYDARRQAYLDALPGRLQSIADHLNAAGILPAGIRLAVAPAPDNPTQERP